MRDVLCRPVNGIGNSWADRVRGMNRASVKSVSEVNESTAESTEVHSQQPLQHAVAAATDKHQVSLGLCALLQWHN